MQNRGTLTTIFLIALVLIVGYWLFNTPKGVAFRQDVRENSQAAVYRTNNYPNNNYMASNNTLVPVDSSSSAYGYKAQPAQMAYVTYPIAKSSSSSQYSVTSPSYTTTTSSYYMSPNPGYNYYPSNPAPQGGCYVSGCSGQICSDQQSAVSTCEYREEYSCYQSARCERQSTGQCGWTMTDQLYSCLQAN